MTEQSINALHTYYPLCLTTAQCLISRSSSRTGHCSGVIHGKQSVHNELGCPYIGTAPENPRLMNLYNFCSITKCKYQIYHEYVLLTILIIYIFIYSDLPYFYNMVFCCFQFIDVLMQITKDRNLKLFFLLELFIGLVRICMW